MAKKVRDLDTPFRPGERVLAACDIDDIESGTSGRVRLANGLGNWRRYWVKFEDGRIRGQVSHETLVRPDQVAAWQQLQDDKAKAALRSEQAVTAASTDAPSGDGVAASGVASRIPASIMERSKAAKARLLG